MGIVSDLLIRSAKNNNTKGVKLALSLYDMSSGFKKFFLRINPFRNTRSFNINNNQPLNKALECTV